MINCKGFCHPIYSVQKNNCYQTTSTKGQKRVLSTAHLITTYHMYSVYKWSRINTHLARIFIRDGTGTASTTLELQRDGISWNMYDLIIYLIGVFRVPESLFHPLPTARSGRTGLWWNLGWSAAQCLVERCCAWSDRSDRSDWSDWSRLHNTKLCETRFRRFTKRATVCCTCCTVWSGTCCTVWSGTCCRNVSSFQMGPVQTGW